MKDRLIELLSDTLSKYNLPEHIADELLANGVIVPPCKVGDKVYSNVLGNIEGFVVVSIELAYTTNGFEGDFVARNGKYPLLSKFDSIGKSVFLTKEEAEQALNGR